MQQQTKFTALGSSISNKLRPKIRRIYTIYYKDINNTGIEDHPTRYFTFNETNIIHSTNYTFDNFHTSLSSALYIQLRPLHIPFEFKFLLFPQIIENPLISPSIIVVLI